MSIRVAEAAPSESPLRAGLEIALALVLAATGCGSSVFHSVREVSELKGHERILVGEVRVEEGDLAQWVPGVYLGSVVVMNDEAAVTGSASPWWATTVGTDVDDERFGRSGGAFVTGAPRTRVFLLGVRVYATAGIVGTSRLLQTPIEIPSAGPACAYIGTLVLRPEGESFAADLRDELELFKRRQPGAVLRGCNLERQLGRLRASQDETVHAPTAREPVRVQIEDRGESYYDFRARNVEEMFSAMSRKGPASPEGTAHAVTTWELATSDVQCARYPDGFRIRSGRVRLELGVLLPKWQNPADGSASLQGQWPTFLQRVRVHEDGHRRNALAAAEALRMALDALEPAVSCEALQQQLKRTVERISQEYVLRDQAYDHETKHGQKQGALLHR